MPAGPARPFRRPLFCAGSFSRSPRTARADSGRDRLPSESARSRFPGSEVRFVLFLFRVENFIFLCYNKGRCDEFLTCGLILSPHTASVLRKSIRALKHSANIRARSGIQPERGSPAPPAVKRGFCLLFSSIEFLLFFFPIVLSVYFLLPAKARNYWLLLSSLFFYAWGEPVFVLIMIFSIGFNYLLALRIEELRDARYAKKIVLIADVAVNLGILFVFKYLNFVTRTLHELIPATQSMFPQTEIALPIGISFFTFQALSYVIDVYRGTPAQKNVGYIGLYISLFPQLIAGPIVRYTTVMHQITDRRVTFPSFSDGLIRFLTGFNKKVLLANMLANVADLAFTAKENSVLMAWLGGICYALQLFYDFSGYSDMAIGLGRMFGFTFLENFDYPYISKTMTEFWRRWHISLGSWFRDYVYFPLGGSRVKRKSRLVFNLFVVWLLTGIWHGANWTFILWGLLHGLAVTVEKLTGIPQKMEKWHPALRICYRVWILLLVLIAWVLFRADTVANAFMYLKTMFGLSGSPLIDDAFRFNFREYIVYLIFAVLCAMPVFKKFLNRIRRVNARLGEAALSAGDLIQLVLFVFSFSFLVMNAHNPFIYFNF